MPVQMIGDILAADLSHMQAYIRFCSCQLNGATLLQQKTDEDTDFKEFLKVRTTWEPWLCCCGSTVALSLEEAAHLLQISAADKSPLSLQASTDRARSFLTVQDSFFSSTLEP